MFLNPKMSVSDLSEVFVAKESLTQNDLCWSHEHAVIREKEMGSLDGKQLGASQTALESLMM